MAFGIDDLIGNVLGIVNKFIPDPAQRAQAESELRASLVSWDSAQDRIDTAEAASPSLFVTGWRPFHRLVRRRRACLSIPAGAARALGDIVVGLQFSVAAGARRHALAADVRHARYGRSTHLRED
jgi:hypothetical protein